MLKYQKMTDSVKELPGSAAPPPGMSLDEFEAMFREIDKEKALLKLTDEQVLELDLTRLDDWELVLAAERFKAMGRDELWLEALERVCRSAEHNVMIWYGDVYTDVVDDLRYHRDYEQAIYYQKLAIQEDLNYCGGVNLVNNQRELAELYLEKGDLEEGLRLFERLIEQDSWDIYHYNNLALTLRDIGLKEMGVLAASRAIEIARVTKDPEHLLPQLTKFLDEAKARIGAPGSEAEMQLASATRRHWHDVLTRPLPQMPHTMREKAQHIASTNVRASRTKVGRNEPCPCGSGKKYKKCCWGKRFDWVIDEKGNICREVPIDDPEMMAALHRMADEFRKEHGRDSGPDEPLFGDIAGDQAIEDMMTDIMERAGSDPAFIYAFKKTGRIVTRQNKDKLTDAELREWQAAIEEYRASRYSAS